MRADGDDDDGNDHGDDNDQWSLTMILTIVMMMIMAMMMGTIVMRHTNMTDGTGKEQELSDFKMLTLIGRYTWTDCKLGGKVLFKMKKCVSAMGALATTKLGQRQWQGFFSSNYANSNFH